MQHLVLLSSKALLLAAVQGLWVAAVGGDLPAELFNWHFVTSPLVIPSQGYAGQNHWWPSMPDFVPQLPAGWGQRFNMHGGFKGAPWALPQGRCLKVKLPGVAGLPGLALATAPDMYAGQEGWTSMTFCYLTLLPPTRGLMGGMGPSPGPLCLAPDQHPG